MTTPERIIAEAREWIGTPYHHHQRLKGVGVDCVGLVIGVGLACNALDWSDSAFERWKGYGRTPNPNRMGEAMRKFLTKGESWEMGAVVWIKFREGVPTHLAIHAGDGVFIHACGKSGRVVENRIESHRIESWWRYPHV